jgi:DNA-binding MarR family transcriptional regulator
MQESGGREGVEPEREISSESVLTRDATVTYLIREAHRALARDLQSRIKPHGVDVGLWRFLRVLWEEDGINQSELSARVGMTAPTTALALDRMEKRGLVVRVRSSKDRRVIGIRLTAKAKSLREKLLPHAAEANAVACRGFTTQEIALLRRMLSGLKNNIETRARRIRSRESAQDS